MTADSDTTDHALGVAPTAPRHYTTPRPDDIETASGTLAAGLVPLCGSESGIVSRSSGESSGLSGTRVALIASAFVLAIAALGAVASQSFAQPAPQSRDQRVLAAVVAPGGTIAAIKVEGNQRIEEATIRSYMLVQPGDRFEADRLDRSLKSIFATGLFIDVTLRREGSVLVVRVVENKIVNRIAFEGNHKLTDEILRPELQLRSRGIFTSALAQSDRQRILDLYARKGRFGTSVVPKIIDVGQNRVDVIFEVNDGEASLIGRIAFIGNKAYSEGSLRDVIVSREEAWWRLLSTSDVYDPDKVNYDRELLRRFYISKGYADFEVLSANTELAPDRSAFFVTFTLNEGFRYRIGKIDITSTLKGIEPDSLRSQVDLDPGDWYDGDAVERSTQAMTAFIQNRGQPFVSIKPQVKRDVEKHEINLTFEVSEGARVYIDRIDVVGNLRTYDSVIRREFRFAEGDALNSALLRRSKTRLSDLDFFNSVNIAPVPGSAPDRGIVRAEVDEKSTGELSFGGGYSTDIGALATAGIRERNLVGTGIDAGINAVLAQKESQINLSVTDPYFLGTNLVAGFDIFRIQNNLQSVALYNQRRLGGDVRIGYEFTEHLRQLLTYTIEQRTIYGVGTGATIYVKDVQGTSLLSQIGQSLTLDYRDSKLDPRSGFVLRVGTDFAGVGGSTNFLRNKIDGAYYYPLERYLGNRDWVIALQAGFGYLQPLGGVQEKIIDRFFLGGDNLRGFAVGGAGPHDISPTAGSANSLGGRMIWTQTTELRFPLPISQDLGITGRFFADIGSLSKVGALRDPSTGTLAPIVDDASPRVGVGFGISWKTPFGLLNIDLGYPVVRKKYDQTQQIRFGFGTRF